MSTLSLRTRIDYVWQEIERKKAYLADLADELADGEAELQGLYQELDELRYETQNEEQA